MVATFAPSNKETLPETKPSLNQVVADLYVAHIASHQVHWYMRGRVVFLWYGIQKWTITWTAWCNLDEVSERLITWWGPFILAWLNFGTQQYWRTPWNIFTKNVEESLTCVLEIFRYLMAFLLKSFDVTDAEGDDVTNDIFVGGQSRTWKEHLDGGCWTWSRTRIIRETIKRGVLELLGLRRLSLTKGVLNSNYSWSEIAPLFWYSYVIFCKRSQVQESALQVLRLIPRGGFYGKSLKSVLSLYS